MRIGLGSRRSFRGGAAALALSPRVALDLATVRSMARSTMSSGLALAELQPRLDVAAKYGVLPAPVDAAGMILT
jgi:hypothetical protein